MRVTILGSGSSPGVPMVGRGWDKCDPNNPKNRRTRPSVLVENKGTRILIDMSPDLREQLLRDDIRHLDGILLTHTHADHLHGIDDIRGINNAMGSAIDLYTSEESLDDVQQRFGYTLKPIPNKPDGSPPSHYYKPVLTPKVIKPGDSFTIGNIPIQVMAQDHGFSETLGFRFGPIAYSTDVKRLGDEAFKTLEGVEKWILGSPLNFDHPTHIHVEGALEWIKRVNPKQAYLSHLGAVLDYETLTQELPEGVEPAYDGLVIDA